MSIIDNFIQEKVQPQHKEIVERFRDLVNKNYPALKEEMRGGTEKYYGVPVYRYKRIIVTLSPTKQGITFSFTDGAQFDDVYGKLEGEGKKSLNLRLYSSDDFNIQQVSYYLDQAIQIDSVKK